MTKRSPWKSELHVATCRLAACAVYGSLFVLGACAHGEYRMPYADGTLVDPIDDFSSHDSPVAYMFDLQAQNTDMAEVVAAAPGWVRWIEDDHSDCGGEGDDVRNNYVWIEHPYPYCQDPSDPNRADWPGKPHDYDETCVPCDEEFCNEWTIYVHFQEGSVTGTAGLAQGDWVNAGDFLGFEDDVGFTDCTVHLHWHVAVLPPTLAPDSNGAYEAYVDAGGGARPERIPRVCHQGGRTLLWRFGTYTAGPCP